MAVAAGMSLLLILPLALAASAGHGYLAPVGFLILALALSQIIIVTGYGEYFPGRCRLCILEWWVPSCSSKVVQLCQRNPDRPGRELGTIAWWELADQAG